MTCIFWSNKGFYLDTASGMCGGGSFAFVLNRVRNAERGIPTQKYGIFNASKAPEL